MKTFTIAQLVVILSLLTICCNWRKDCQGSLNDPANQATTEEAISRATGRAPGYMIFVDSVSCVDSVNNADNVKGGKFCHPKDVVDECHEFCATKLGMEIGDGLIFQKARVRMAGDSVFDIDIRDTGPNSVSVRLPDSPVWIMYRY